MNNVRQVKQLRHGGYTLNIDFTFVQNDSFLEFMIAYKKWQTLQLKRRTAEINERKIHTEVLDTLT